MPLYHVGTYYRTRLFGKQLLTCYFTSVLFKLKDDADSGIVEEWQLEARAMVKKVPGKSFYGA
jgi:hypothetical protein